MTPRAGQARARSAVPGRLAWLALLGQVVFVVGWIVAGALEPGYSHVEQGVSELSMRGSEHAWILSGAVLVLGASIAAFAPALRMTLPAGGGAALAAGLFAAAGVAIAATALLPLECPMSETACRARWRAGELPWQHEAHLWAGLAFQLLLAATPLALARALWPRPVALAALQAGIVGLALSGLLWLGYASEADGLVQRLGFGVVHVWIALVAAGVLYAVRAPATPASFTMRPPGALSRVWRGDGQMVLRPALLWRRFPQRFRYRREVNWITDDLWLVEDEAVFDRGWTVRRRLYCAVVAPATLEVTAPDMPDGGQATIEEDGYTVSPYRLALLLGPLQPVVTCREHARVEDEEALRGTMELRWLGVPAATLTAVAQSQSGDQSVST